MREHEDKGLNTNWKISVIVPIYKVERYIYKCIESICNQSYSNLEILLIDDGSPDYCGAICDEFAKKDSRIKVFHIQNSGQSHARNVGLSVATGDFIGFVDGDDWIHEDMYERLLTTAIEKRADIVECNFIGRKEKLPDKIEEGIKVVLDTHDAIIRQLDWSITSRYPSTSVWSKLFRRICIEGLFFPDGKIHEEFSFLCEAFLNADKYVYFNKCLYERTLRDDSTTAEKFSLRTMDKIYVYQMRNEMLIARGETELLSLSKQQEFILLIHFVVQAKNFGLKSEQQVLENLIFGQKKAILRSNLPIRKKMQYIIFFINRELYYSLKNKM